MKINSVQEDDRVRLVLPGTTDTIYAKTISIRERSDSSTVWSGLIDCNKEELLFIYNSSPDVRYIKYQGVRYTVRKLYGDYTVLNRHKDDVLKYAYGHE